ncbi:hypothetical protein [Methylobacterium pseudosasicola]|uniref:Uncharacterized protein n=1 Tax=Methylobacterium pseudosasicola TaxID=582667 RepID=A0A1I4VCQ0_9HYPH|nr:hypothetical protein [Methylobacterium pseudosasicola]SFM98944.1 hypothetical protein SAMN05192568_10946 [Methylobacterium pseudosasicola]
MADEALRMQAEVQDKFSGPLKALRSQLLDTARTGANHSDTLVKGFKSVESTMQSTARTASSVVNPAFAALGVTGLTAGAAVAGISAALNKLTGNLTGLGQLTRDTGIAAKTLQEFGAVAGRFGIEQDAVAQGAKNFAAQMRTFSRSTGDAFNWVIHQGTNAAGRKAFQNFATDLQHTSDEGEKLKKALTFMETIKNPVERGIFARQFFGNDDFQRLADQHLGTVTQMFKQARERLGAYDPADIINAEKFDRSISSLRSSMQRFGLTVARELLGPATEFTTWMDTLVSGERADVTKSLREGLQGVKKELGEINWKQFGEDTVAGLKAGTALAGSLASALHEITQTIHSLRNGNYAEAFSHADNVAGPVLPGKDPGADGPLRRRLAPRVGDDEIEARQRVEDLKKLRDAAQEAQGHFIGRTQQRMGLLGAPGSYDKDLDAAQAKLKALEGRTPEQRQKDFEASDKLRRSIDSLTDEMKASRGGATVQKQSMDTQGGLFGGATIQSAAFGGGFRRGGYGGGANLPGGGSGPGYGGEQGPAGGGRSFSGGGRFNGLGGSRPSIAPIGPRPDVPSLAPPGGYKGISARDMKNVNPEMAEYIRQSAIAHGIDPNVALRIANSEGLRGSVPGVRNTPGDKGTSFGPFQLHYGSNIPGLTLKGLGDRYTRETGHHASDPKHWKEQIDFALRTARKEGWGAWHGRIGAGIGLRDGIGTVRPVPIPSGRSATAERADGGVTDFFPNGAPRVLKPNSMGGAPSLTMDQANAMRGGKADGAGWAAREAARKTFEAQQAEADGLRASGARVASAASRAGVVAMPQIENNGSVVVNIHKAGPETRVATTASGKLFQDVVQRSGAQMRRAD